MLVCHFPLPSNKFAAAQARTEQNGALENIATNRPTIPLSPKALFSRGETRVYKGQYLEAIDFTIGGIGAGCIRLNGKAKPFVWQLFNNLTQAFVPHSFLALRVKPENGKVFFMLDTQAGSGLERSKITEV